MDPTPSNLDLSLVSLFAGWAMADEIQRRLTADGLGELRFNDGVVFQHVLAGPLSISALAERMGVTQQAASKAVAELERRGLLRREPDPADARSRLLHLTEKAGSAIAGSRKRRAALEKEITAEYGEQRVADAKALLAAIIGRYGEPEAIRGRRVRPPL
ncbi:DNA-binding transcriptional regulator, MarR family [Amycolatopsis keratiniphila]|nr:DNA-binding transcriptional regulator, MarR family [Amycolatopsis keratiniphila]